MLPKHDAHSHSHPDAKALRAHFSRIAAQAESCGLTAEAAEALIGIDASVFAWRRRMLKGEMARQILESLELDVEQAEFEALTALSRLTYGASGAARTDITVGDIAEELTIDPSRASRLVSALVNKGYIRRAVAQDDARKTVLKPTKASYALFDAFMALKWRVVFEAFRSWSQQDIVAFERLFSHYVGSMADAIDNVGADRTKAAQFADTIREAIAAELKDR